jgi:hypothetical protein
VLIKKHTSLGTPVLSKQFQTTEKLTWFVKIVYWGLLAQFAKHTIRNTALDKLTYLRRNDTIGKDKNDFNKSITPINC